MLNRTDTQVKMIFYLFQHGKACLCNGSYCPVHVRIPNCSC